MKLPRLSRPRLGLATKFCLSSLLIVCVSFLLFATIAFVIADQQTQTRLSLSIGEGIDDMQTRLSHRESQVVALGTRMAADKTLQGVVDTQDSSGLTKYLGQLDYRAIVDRITVVDAQGFVLAHYDWKQRESFVASLASEAGVRQALAGHHAGGLEQDQQGNLLESQYVPIYNDAKPDPRGAIVLSFYIEDEAVGSGPGTNGLATALVYEDQIVYNSPDEDDGKAMPAPASVILAEHEGTKSDLQALSTRQGTFLFEFVPLTSPLLQTSAAMYGIGVPTRSLDDQRTGLLRTYGLGLLAIFVVTSIIALMSARILIAPVRTLNDAMSTMAAGDFSTRIQHKSNDEWGDLGRNLELLRENVRQALDSARLEQIHDAAALKAMQAAIVITDRDHRIAFVNPAAQTLLGQSQAALQGQPWHQLFQMDAGPDNTIPFSWSNAAPSKSHQVNPLVRGRFPLRHHPDRILDIVSAVLDVEGESAGHVHVLHDASEQEMLARTKDEFMLNVAHELRAPLASLRISIDLLNEDHATMSRHDLGVMLRNLQKMVVRFQAIVITLVDMNNIRAGRFRVHPIPVEVSKLIRNAVDQTRSLLEAKGQELEQPLEMGTAKVMADPARITQVLVNLLTNASKYSPANSRILLSCSSAPKSIQIGITDCGPGIPPEEQDLVFKRFYRVKRNEEEGTGIGIGLELAKEIVEAHGGEIFLKSLPGEGTTFYFCLPKVSSEAPMILEREGATADESPSGR